MATLLDTQTRYLEADGETGFGDWGFVGEETYGTTEKAALAESIALRGRRWPGISGPTAPVCLKTRIIYAPDTTEHEALIIATYKSPPWVKEFYEMLLPGRGRLKFKVSKAADKTVTRDVETGAVIEGPGAPGQYWQVVKGSNVVETYKTELELETAYPTSHFRLARVLALEGRVNAGPFKLMNFGTMAPETCKCLGVETIQPVTTYDPWVLVKYFLQWSGPDKTWNDVETQPGEWIVRKYLVYEVDHRGRLVPNLKEQKPVLKEMEAFAPGVVWDPVKAEHVPVAPQRRRVYKLADFSILQGIRPALRTDPWPRLPWSMRRGMLG